MKPGAHGLVWALPRTSHWTATALEDAGFEIRDVITHHFGSGFPKSLDVSKAIDGLVQRGRSDSLSLREVNETRPGKAQTRPHSQNGWKGFVGGEDEGTLTSGAWNGVVNASRGGVAKGAEGQRIRADRLSDSGGASRFFYTAKASSADRNAGLFDQAKGKNRHPTVKSVELMRWLCRLITPPGGLILDPFCGSGSTLVAARLEGFQSIGIDQDQESVQTTIRRMGWANHQPSLFE
jgi:site-specific DNA-methyltransferase (adenine-specific)